MLPQKNRQETMRGKDELKERGQEIGSDTGIGRLFWSVLPVTPSRSSRSSRKWRVLPAWEITERGGQKRSGSTTGRRICGGLCNPTGAAI